MSKKEKKEEQVKRIMAMASKDIRRLKFGRIIIYVQDGHPFRIETVESSTGDQ